MMDPYDRFELMVNGQVVKTPVALASMAGVVDAEYVLSRTQHAGIAFIGGYSVDEKTMGAGRQMVASGRKEFIVDDPVSELKKQISALNGSDIVIGINIRASAPDSYVRVAEALGKDVIYEIDAHCRQQAMIDAGCGEYYLHHPDILADTVRALKETGVTVSVKIRAGVADDDKELARMIWKAGADILHVDLMDFGHGKIRQIRNSCPLILIANNSINTPEIMKDLLQHGADIVSLARQADNATLSVLDAWVSRYADETGWYNAPKQLCRGGDIRSLTFCCIPVKNCPLPPLLDRLGIAKKDYMEFKLESVKNTPLAAGENTCFGSLAWCCKSSTPCMFRDMTLKQQGLTKADYMRYKHRLSEKIIAKVFDEKEPDQS